MAVQIQIRRDTAANWTAANSVLADGEIGYEKDTGQIKIGDGTTAWTTLAYKIANLVSGTVPLSELPTSSAQVFRSTTGTPTVLGTDVNGDFAYDPATTILYGPMASGAWPTGVKLRQSRKDLIHRTGAISTTFDLQGAATNGSTVPAGSGTLYLEALGLFAGDVVSNIGFFVAGTAAVTPTHWWYVLADSNLVVRAVTADQATAALPLNTEQILPVVAAYTIPSDGLYYIGVMVVAATMPTWLGVVGTTIQSQGPPKTAGTSNTGQTTPPALGATLTAITANGYQLYGLVS